MRSRRIPVLPHLCTAAARHWLGATKQWELFSRASAAPAAPPSSPNAKSSFTKIGRLAPGKAVITAAGRLPAKFVIHTVGPIYRNGKRGEPETLASAHRESIRLTT